MFALRNYLHRNDEFTVNILKEAPRSILSPLAFAPDPRRSASQGTHVAGSPSAWTRAP